MHMQALLKGAQLVFLPYMAGDRMQQALGAACIAAAMCTYAVQATTHTSARRTPKMAPKREGPSRCRFT